MWVSGMLTTVPLLLLAVWRWASAEERATPRAEALDRPRPDASLIRVSGAGGVFDRGDAPGPSTPSAFNTPMRERRRDDGGARL